MSDDTKKSDLDDPQAEASLLPPREVMSVLSDPTALGSISGIGGLPATAPAGPDPAAGTGDAAGSLAGHAQGLADQQPHDGGTVSDQPQSLSSESSKSAASQT
jgi:hypothetical protein